jgi:transposase-like protein
MKKNKEDYPEKKKRDLTEVEKKEIRKDIEQGDDNIYELAKKFGCSASQVAGVKAYLKRSGKKE